jgi:hypothetical protein
MAAPASAARAAMIDASICATPTGSHFGVRAGSKEILGSAVKLTGMAASGSIAAPDVCDGRIVGENNHLPFNGPNVRAVTKKNCAA